jgi:2-polyprenyl-3-methyl-5-hydroxy-6-metoxy-1,4-benzoquinol methylase
MNIKNCPICTQEASLYCSKDRANYFRCDFCGTIFQHPLPTLQEMMDYANAEYSDGLYKEYLEANDLKYATFEYRLNKVIEAFKKQNHSETSPRILDVGCSNGRFIEVALRNRIDAWGLELSENAIAAATPAIRSRIYHGDANNIESLGAVKFDIITAFDLVEHLFDPFSFLNNLCKIVTKDGIVVITTPDASSLPRILMGKNWPMLQPFQHTILLSRKASQVLLQKTNYKNVLVDGTKKVFTLDYLFNQLKGPNPNLYQIYNRFNKILPSFIKENKIQVNIGEMMISASPISSS